MFFCKRSRKRLHESNRKINDPSYSLLLILHQEKEPHYENKRFNIYCINITTIYITLL